MVKVLVSDNLADDGIAALKEAGIEVDLKPGLSEDELCDIIGEYDGLIVRSQTEVNPTVIERADRLRVIGRAGVGIDNVNLDAATRRGIIVMNTPGGNTVATAEHTLSLMLGLARNVAEAHMSVEDGKWERKKFTGTELFGKTLGILGLGRVGGEVAKRARAFDMRLIAYDPLVAERRAQNLDVELTSLENVLRSADYLTLHMPLTNETRGFVNKERIAMMKKGARLINCARGGLVDEDALAEALESGHLAGAGLDVYGTEPPTNSPLVKAPNVTHTPHLAASTNEAQRSVAVEIARQVAEALLSGTVRNAVNMPQLEGADLNEMQPYLGLAEQLGRFQSQIARGKASAIQVRFEGELPISQLGPITVGILKGFMESKLGGAVNYVNAPLLAKENGIDVVETKSSPTLNYAHLVAVKIVTDAGEQEVGGTIFGTDDARLVLIDGYRIDAVPEGAMLVIYNEDKPKIIGPLGMLLGDAGINIANMTLGRKKMGGQAITVLNLDAPISEEHLTEIRKIPNINDARLVVF